MIGIELIELNKIYPCGTPQTIPKKDDVVLFIDTN